MKHSEKSMTVAMPLKIIVSAIADTAFLALPIIHQTNATAQDSRGATNKRLSIPSSIEAEHQELHEELAKIIRQGGRTAIAAEQVEKLLRPHFVKEESFALPPLGVLSDVAAGNTPANAESIIKMSDRLKVELPGMPRDHQEIVAALQQLREAAEGRQDAIRFADHLIAHATGEEQIFYPSAILVGDYLKLKKK